jgi:hypothetical protein
MCGRYNSLTHIFEQLMAITENLKIYRPLLEQACENNNFYPFTVSPVILYRRCRMY